MVEKKDTTQRAVGRRKEAAARVRITPGKGLIIINGRELNHYFGVKIWQNIVLAPMLTVGQEGKYDVSVKVAGGGSKGQADAIRHGISRALVAWNEDFRPVLKAAGFLTRDARAKERKKPGLYKARRGHQWRKR